MRTDRKNQSFLVLTVAIVFGLLFGAGAHSATPGVSMQLQPAGNAGVKDARWRRAGPQLTALHEQFAAYRASGSAQAFAHQVPYLKVANDMVVIEAAADGDVDELKTSLAALGAVDIVAFKRLVSARLPLAAIPRLADVPTLRFARPAMARTRVGATTSQGDVAMNTDDARSAFGVDGTGITVGALSDSFDCPLSSVPGDYPTDEGTGDLPAGIEVLDDTACSLSSIDEGRAMLQIIFDVAPEAGLSFHTADAGQPAFALGIQELAGCPPGSEPGCLPAAVPAHVIVDDILYFAEPFFQDGIIAQAVDVVADAGTVYFSAAGNSARASWDGFSGFRSSGLAPLSFDPLVYDAHDFDPGAGTDIYQKVSVPAGATVFFSLQWDEPFFSASGPPGASNDLDICVFDEPVTELIGCAQAFNVGDDPVEIFSLDNTEPVAVAVNFSIAKYLPEGGPDPDHIKYVAFDDAFSVVDAFDPAFEDTTASTLVGHSNAAHGIGVGAAFYGDTPAFGEDPALLQPFSSAGGTPILFDPTGAPLPMPEIRQRPQITAPDGGNTTFFFPGVDPEGDSFPNFFGTSASAPHAAGVAALMLEASPGLTPNGIEDVMTSSASGQDMEVPGFDFDSGFGFLDGESATASVDDSGFCDGVADLELSGTPGPGTYSATSSITLAGGDFSDGEFLAPEHIFADGFESGDTSSWSNTCP